VIVAIAFLAAFFRPTLDRCVELARFLPFD